MQTFTVLVEEKIIKQIQIQAENEEDYLEKYHKYKYQQESSRLIENLDDQELKVITLDTEVILLNLETDDEDDK